MKRIALVALVAAIMGCQQDTTAPISSAPIKAPAFTVVTAPCTWVQTDGSPVVETLQGDCQTDETLYFGNNTLVNGNGHTITAVDPEGGHFVGAVLANAPYTNGFHVTNVTITASGLSNVCDDGAERLRGVMLEGSSGSVTYSTIRDLNQVGSGCQEGNSIEVRNFGMSSSTISVEIANNTISDFMKTGIVVNGDVNGNVHNNSVGASANQAYLAANSIQFGFGASGVIKANRIDGNQWCGADVGTGLLLYLANGVNVTQNIFGGNSNVGIYVYGDNNTVNNNKVFDDGSIADCGEDYGIYNGGANSLVKNNKVGGFDTQYANVVGGNNKTNPNK